MFGTGVLVGAAGLVGLPATISASRAVSSVPAYNDSSMGSSAGAGWSPSARAILSSLPAAKRLVAEGELTAPSRSTAGPSNPFSAHIPAPKRASAEAAAPTHAQGRRFRTGAIPLTASRSSIASRCASVKPGASSLANSASRTPPRARSSETRPKASSSPAISRSKSARSVPSSSPRA